MQICPKGEGKFFLHPKKINCSSWRKFSHFCLFKSLLFHSTKRRNLLQMLHDYQPCKFLKIFFAIFALIFVILLCNNTSFRDTFCNVTWIVPTNRNDKNIFRSQAKHHKWLEIVMTPHTSEKMLWFFTRS